MSPDGGVHCEARANAHRSYAVSCRDLGAPRLPRSKGWILESPIPQSPEFDAKGCYPLFSCTAWRKLEKDLEELHGSIVALAVVPDPSATMRGPISTGASVLPVPGRMTPKPLRLPSEQKVEPWYEAVCELWDDPALYDAAATRGRQTAQEGYSEEVSRKRDVDYFTSLKPGGHPLAERAPRTSSVTHPPVSPADDPGSRDLNGLARSPNEVEFAHGDKY